MRLTKDKMVATLRNVSIFSALPQEALEEMAALAEVVSVHAGQAILSEGESSRDLFIIVEGRVQLGKLGRSMRELGPNQSSAKLTISKISAHSLGYGERIRSCCALARAVPGLNTAQRQKQCSV